MVPGFKPILICTSQISVEIICLVRIAKIVSLHLINLVQAGLNSSMIDALMPTGSPSRDTIFFNLSYLMLDFGL